MLLTYPAVDIGKYTDWSS